MKLILYISLKKLSKCSMVIVRILSLPPLFVHKWSRQMKNGQECWTKRYTYRGKSPHKYISLEFTVWAWNLRWGKARQETLRTFSYSDTFQLFKFPHLLCHQMGPLEVTCTNIVMHKSQLYNFKWSHLIRSLNCILR